MGKARLITVAFALYLLWTRLDQIHFCSALSSIEAVVKLGMQLVFVICCVAFFALEDKSIERTLLQGLILLAGIAASMLSGQKAFLWICIFYALGNGIETKQLAKVSIIVNVSVIMLGVMLTIAGGLAPYGMQADGGIALIRRPMGFDHPNQLGACITSIYITLLYLRSRQVGLKELLVLLGLSAFVLISAGSRTSIVSMLSAYAIFIIGNRCHERKKIRIFTILLLSITWAFSIYMMIWYMGGDPIQATINSLLTGRLQYTHASYLHHSVDILGNQIMMSDPDAWYLVDNAPANFLITFGIIPTILYIFATFHLIYTIDTRKQSAILQALACCLVFGITEKTAFYFDFNYYVASNSIVNYVKPRWIRKVDQLRNE